MDTYPYLYIVDSHDPVSGTTVRATTYPVNFESLKKEIAALVRAGLEPQIYCAATGNRVFAPDLTRPIQVC